MSRADGEGSTDVVEMDAMDVVEWERDQHTPVAPVSADLVKQSAAPERPPVPATGRNPRTAMAVPLGATPAAGLPRATAPASRPVNPTTPAAQPLVQQLLKSPMAHTTQRAPRLSSATVPTPPALQQAIVNRAKGGPALPVAPTAAPAPAPAPVSAPAPGGSEGWDDLDGAWDEAPKATVAQPEAKAYSAPAIARTATPNTFRRDSIPSLPRVQPVRGEPATRASSRVGLITEPMPTVAQPPNDAAKSNVDSTALPSGSAVPRARAKVDPTALPSGSASPRAPAKLDPTALPSGSASPRGRPKLASITAPRPAVAPPAVEPALLPPPPIGARGDDDWDGLAPSKPSKPSKVAPKQAARPSARPMGDFGEDGEDGENAEPSVIIDLGAKPVVAPPDMDQDLAALALAADAIGGPGPRAPIYTSEESTTASGVFVMPTAAAPTGKSIGTRARMAPAEPHDDLAVPSLAPPLWHPALTPAGPAAASATAPGGWDRSVAAPVPPTAPPTESPARPPGVAFAFAPAMQQAAPLQPAQPTPLQPAPSLGAPGWQHVPANQPPVAHAEPTQRQFVPARAPRSRRLVLLIAGGALLLVVLLVVVLGGGSSKGDAPAEPAVAVAPASAPERVPAAPAKPAVVAATEPPAVVEPSAPVGPVGPIAPVAAPNTPARPPGRRPARPAKPLVLDYDKPRTETGPTSPTQDQALARARAAYATGNQHLFAGEADAAITAYKQALAVYPGYVAGYRGLGLAYAQSGDRAAALKAFKTYVGLVPNAKDAALIEKRIARLSTR